MPYGGIWRRRLPLHAIPVSTQRCKLLGSNGAIDRMTTVVILSGGPEDFEGSLFPNKEADLDKICTVYLRDVDLINDQTKSYLDL